METLNHMPAQERATLLEKCCGSRAWVHAMNQAFPLGNLQKLLDKATQIWYGLTEADWREAFTHHPKIGDVESLKEKFASTAAWAEGEQGGVQQASDQTLQALAEGNRLYEEKFGYIFIVCATGKSADEMLALLQARLPNPPEDELLIAIAEQDKITRLRLEKLLTA